MKTKIIVNPTLAGLLAVCMVAPVQADDPAESRNLFETAGKKADCGGFQTCTR